MICSSCKKVISDNSSYCIFCDTQVAVRASSKSERDTDIHNKTEQTNNADYLSTKSSNNKQLDKNKQLLYTVICCIVLFSIIVFITNSKSERQSNFDTYIISESLESINSIPSSETIHTSPIYQRDSFSVDKLSSTNNHSDTTNKINESEYKGIDSANDIQQNPSFIEDDTTTTEYQPGYYIVNASEDEIVYFYKMPDKSTIKNAYFDSKENVYVQKFENGFGYIEFTNDRGQTSIGWLDMDDLTLISKEPQ
jgi:hypothetical protein